MSGGGVITKGLAPEALIPELLAPLPVEPAPLAPHMMAHLVDLGIERVEAKRMKTPDGALGWEVRLRGRGETAHVVAYGSDGVALSLRNVVVRAIELWTAAVEEVAREGRAARGCRCAPAFRRVSREVL